MAAICTEKSDRVISEASLDQDIKFLSLHNGPVGGSAGLSGCWSLSPPHVLLCPLVFLLAFYIWSPASYSLKLAASRFATQIATPLSPTV